MMIKFHINISSVTVAPTRPPAPVNPCLPDPCGPFSQCRDQGGVAACSCLPGYIGVPPNCRPECVLHSECPSNLAWIREKYCDCSGGKVWTIMVRSELFMIKNESHFFLVLLFDGVFC